MSYDIWKTTDPTWAEWPAAEDDDSDRYEYETACQEIAMAERASADARSDIRRNARYVTDYDRAFIQREAEMWAELANDMTRS